MKIHTLIIIKKIKYINGKKYRFSLKCGAQNFKRRYNCFKCHASRMESEEGGSGSDEICTYATKSTF